VSILYVRYLWLERLYGKTFQNHGRNVLLGEVGLWGEA
jgi:hypothetical protein